MTEEEYDIWFAEQFEKYVEANPDVLKTILIKSTEKQSDSEEEFFRSIVAEADDLDLDTVD